MTEFNPLIAARILQEGPLRRIEDEAIELSGRAFTLRANGVPRWHRVIHELEAEADALWDRYYSLKDHIKWLYDQAVRQLVPRLANR